MASELIPKGVGPSVNRAAFVAASCAALAARPVSAQTPMPTLRIGANLSDSYASGVYAKEMGFFARYGLNGDVQTVGNGAAEAAAVSSGTLDIGISTPDRLAVAHEHGFPFVIVAAGQLSTERVRAEAICIAANSTIKTAKDLEGKTVAMNGINGVGQIGFDAWLTRGGADYTKIKLFELTASEIGPSIERGTVDAGLIFEPLLTQALGRYHLRVLTDPDYAIAPQFVNSCWFATRQFAQANADAVSRFCRAIYAAQQWANTHLAERAAILAKLTKVSSDVAQATVFSPYAERLNLADFQPVFDLALKYGTLTRPLAAADIVYQSS